MSNEERLLLFYLIMLWVFLGVGYAYLNSNLEIKGTSNIAKTSWNIYFSNIKYKDGNVEASTPATIVDNTTINMEVTLNDPGDSYSFDVDVINSGTIDAKLAEILKTNLTTEQAKHLDYTVTYSDGNELKQNDLLKANSTDTLTVTVKYKDGDYVSDDTDLNLSLTLNYVQDDGTGNGTRIRYNIGDNTLGSNNWYKNLVLNFEIKDDENINSVKYCVTTDDTCVADKDISKTDGVYKVNIGNNKSKQVACLAATDNKGKKYSRCSNNYYVDNVVPTLSISTTKDTTNKTISIKSTASDSYSGIDKYYYSKDNGTSYIESNDDNYTFTSLSDGTYNIKVYVVDVAGNISSVESQDVTFSSPVQATKKIKDLATTDTTNMVADDGTADHNTRYIGANPNNYVKFNDELWRIIGVFNNIKTTASGDGEARIKIIRNDSLGNYSWDSSSSSVNGGHGVNEWNQADLMNELNTDYLGNITIGTDGKWYSSPSNGKYTSMPTTKLSSEAQSQIDDAVWNLGSAKVSSSNEWYNQTNTPSTFYNWERSSNTGKQCSGGSFCNDSVTRKTTWTGKVGLMYPSDYGYATSGGSTSGRNTCLEYNLFNWNSYSNCYNNDYLYKNYTQCTLSPAAYSSDSFYVFYVYSYVYNSYAVDTDSRVRPAVFLKSSVMITSGIGSQDDPFILSNS